jgi:nitroreductase
MGDFAAMYSLRAMRRLKSDPVTEQALAEILEAATQAASAVNRHNWRFLVIRDRAVKEKIAYYYGEAWNHACGAAAAHDPSSLEPASRRVLKAASHLAHHLAKVPVLILARMPGRPLTEARAASSRYGSVYPAVQNLMLAARTLGLGTTLTTLHKRHDKEIKELPDIPEDVETICPIPLGYPEARFGPARRRPAAEVTYYDRRGRQSPPH